jgi:stage IV sporulation protein A
LTPSGVVGPVRTGKSTLIKRFMDLMVIPNIENEHTKERARDELPQSASGKTIMTTEPKFVPNEAVKIHLDGDTELKVRLVDCVGYLVKGAIGHMEDDVPRMVTTPWFEHQIPFAEAAEIGTRKVIRDHSTIGLVVTTDGSISDIDRMDYIEAEERVITELKELHKPFVVILNSTKPSHFETEKIRQKMEEQYGVPVVAANCAQLKVEEFHSIMEKILFEFPIREIFVNIPKWYDALVEQHWLKMDVLKAVKESFLGISKISQVKACMQNFVSYEFLKKSIH